MFNFRKEMKTAIEQANMDNVEIKLDALREEANRYNSKSENKQEIETINQIITFGEKSFSSYKDSEIFSWKVAFALNSAYYTRGLDYMYKRNYFHAISDFEKCRKYNIIVKQEDSPALIGCLLKCYIYNRQYKNGIELLETIQQINKETIDGRKGDNFFNILREENSQESLELLSLLEKVAVE